MASPLHSGRVVHACHVSRSRRERARSFARFLRHGLEKDQRLYCVVDDVQDPTIARELVAELPEVELASARELYTQGESFDPERVLKTYEEAVSTARAEGYAGVRVAADTGWLSQAPPEDRQRFLDYEHLVNEHFADGRFAALCHYDATHLPADFQRALAAAHPFRVDGRTLWGLAADTCRLSPRNGTGLRLAGEVDFANAARLQVLLEEFAPTHEEVHLDASGLEFIDVSGLRALVHACQELGAERRLLIHHAPPLMRMMAHLAGWAERGRLEFVDRGGDFERVG